MRNHDSSPRHHQVLYHLSEMPRKIIAMHETNHSAEFVLHELALSGCFNLGKAAYFVDNPDFDCFIGIAGYDTREHNGQTSWAASSFPTHLPGCGFNSTVRSVGQASPKRAHQDLRDMIAALAEKLSMRNPHCHTWDMKHDNQGVLLYENHEDEARELEEHLHNGLHFFSFCPVV